MSATARLRHLALPVCALALVAIVLVVQLANGGGRFAPSSLADPCAARSIPQQPRSLDALGQDLVLLGLDGAACRLGTSREALILDLARHHTDPSDEQVSALRAGLTDAVDRMKAEGVLPPAAELVDEALDLTDLNGLVKAAISALPDAVVNRALPTDEVLRQAVANLDVRALLGNLDDAGRLSDLVTQAVVEAVKQTLTARLGGLV